MKTTITKKQYKNIGIFSHGNHFSFEFVQTILSGVGNIQFLDFLRQLKTKTNFENLDLFSCYFGNSDQFIVRLESGLSINVRASTNTTGNRPFGNWIMETDHINVKNLYFNDGISTFDQSLNIQPYVLSQLTNELKVGTNMIYSNRMAFAALKGDGSVVTWGNALFGGASSSVYTDLTSGVEKIYSVESGAFAALKENGSVVTWGHSLYGGDSSTTDLTSGVDKIYTTGSAFAALKENGSVVTWGHSLYGGDSSTVATLLTSGVDKIYSNTYAFATLKENGSVVTWGYSDYGGDSSSVQTSLSNGLHTSGVDPFHIDPSQLQDPSILDDYPELQGRLTGGDPYISLSTGGDPYISPLEGNIVKLRNCSRTYRLLQCDTFVVNVEVDHVDFKTEMDPTLFDGKTVPVHAGYFYSRFVVVSRPSGSVLADLDLRNTYQTVVDDKATTWATPVGTDENTDGPFIGRYHTRTLQLPTGKVEIRAYSNPQIRNELVFSFPDSFVFDGLLRFNYRPMLFGNLKSCKDPTEVRVPTGNRNLFTNKSIVGHREVSASIHNPELYNKMFR